MSLHDKRKKIMGNTVPDNYTPLVQHMEITVSDITPW